MLHTIFFKAKTVDRFFYSLFTIRQATFSHTDGETRGHAPINTRICISMKITNHCLIWEGQSTWYICKDVSLLYLTSAVLSVSCCHRTAHLLTCAGEAQYSRGFGLHQVGIVVHRISVICWVSSPWTSKKIQFSLWTPHPNAFVPGFGYCICIFSPIAWSVSLNLGLIVEEHQYRRDNTSFSTSSSHK